MVDGPWLPPLSPPPKLACCALIHPCMFAIFQQAAALRGAVAPPFEGPASCHPAAAAAPCVGASTGSSNAVPCASCTCRERLTPESQGVEVEQEPPAKRLRIAA